MTEKRYYQRDFEELYYVIDSNVISEKEFDEKEMYDGYTAFQDSMTGEEIVDLLNENEQLKQQVAFLEEFLKSGVQYEYYQKVYDENEELKQSNERLLKMLDNVANFMQRENKYMPIDDFVEWWNKIATKGLDGDVE